MYLWGFSLVLVPHIQSAKISKKDFTNDTILLSRMNLIKNPLISTNTEITGNGSLNKLSKSKNEIPIQFVDSKVWKQETRQGRNLAESSTPEKIEELPKPEALMLPVPTFISNMFSFRGSREPQTSRQGNGWRSQRRPFHPISTETKRLSTRKEKNKNHNYRSDPVDENSREMQGYFSNIESNDYHNYNYDTSHTGKLKYPSRIPIFDSDAFQQPPMSGEQDRKGRPTYSSQLKKTAQHKYPSVFQVLDSEALQQLPMSGEQNIKESQRMQSSFKNKDIPQFDALPTFEYNDGDGRNSIRNKYDNHRSVGDEFVERNDFSYEIGSGNPTRNEIETRHQNHRYQSGEEKFLGGLFNRMSSLNPMNLFRSSDSEQFKGRSRENSGRKKFKPDRYSNRASPMGNVHHTDSSTVLDYSEFDEYSEFTGKDANKKIKSDFNSQFGHSDLPLARNGPQRNYPNSNWRRLPYPIRNQQLQVHNFPNKHFKENSHDRKERPTPPNRHDPRRLHHNEHRLESVRDAISTNGNGLATRNQNQFDDYYPLNKNALKHHYGNNGHEYINGPEHFIPDVPSLEIKYEDVPQVREDPRLEAFKYKEDFPLRDDLYVGKDGNIYIKERDANGDKKSKSASMHNSDSFLGLQMYGMDDPQHQQVLQMYGMDDPQHQQVSQPRTQTLDHIKGNNDNSLKNHKQSRGLSSEETQYSLHRSPAYKGSLQADENRMKTTAHRRPPPGTHTVPANNFVKEVNLIPTNIIKQQSTNEPRLSTKNKSLMELDKSIDQITNKQSELSEYRRYYHLTD